MKGFNYKKSVQSLCFLAKKHGGTLNKMKAIKLVWLADRLHLRRYGRTITGDVYFAMSFGPVASTTLDLVKPDPFLSEVEKSYSQEFIGEFTKHHYSLVSSPDLNVFSRTDFDCINEINETFGGLDQFMLSTFSHQFPEWKKYESSLNSSYTSRFEMDLDDFFLNVYEQSHLFEDSEEDLRLSKDIFHENQQIEKVL